MWVDMVHKAVGSRLSVEGHIYSSSTVAVHSPSWDYHSFPKGTGLGIEKLHIACVQTR